MQPCSTPPSETSHPQPASQEIQALSHTIAVIFIIIIINFMAVFVRKQTCSQQQVCCQARCETQRVRPPQQGVPSAPCLPDSQRLSEGQPHSPALDTVMGEDICYSQTWEGQLTASLLCQVASHRLSTLFPNSCCLMAPAW